MENNKKELKKYVILILIAIVLYWCINNMATLGSVLSKIIEIIFPFILGGALAFVLNIPMTFFENKLSKTKKKGKKKNPKFIRTISLVLAVLVIGFILFLIINLVLPELIDIIGLLIKNIPYYAEEISKFIQDNTENVQEIESFISNINFDTESIKNELMNLVSSVLSSSISIVVGVVEIISNFIISVIFAIYLLMGNDKLKEQCIKLI